MITKPPPTFAPDAPARHIMRHIPHSIEAVAPERAQQLHEQWNRLGIQLVLSDAEHWVCHYDPSTREIRISLGAVTVLWCFSHAYVVLHDRVFRQWLDGEKRQIDLTADPVVDEAMRLLAWALSKWADDPAACDVGWTTRWPEGLLRPIEAPNKGTPENVADELSLVAVAFLLHHELAHASLGHTRRADPAESVQQEQDADATAAGWLLSGLSHEDKFFTKRALGIATALAAVTALGVHTGYYGGSTHPRHFDRLKHALDPYLQTEHHAVWQFIVVALKLHMDHVGLEIDVPSFESGRDCFEHYLDVLADHAERGQEAPLP